MLRYMYLEWGTMLELQKYAQLDSLYIYIYIYDCLCEYLIV